MLLVQRRRCMAHRTDGGGASPHAAYSPGGGALSSLGYLCRTSTLSPVQLATRGTGSPLVHPLQLILKAVLCAGALDMRMP